MHDDSIFGPLFFTGLGLSAVILTVVRFSDADAERDENRLYYDHVLGHYVRGGRLPRLLVGGEPLLASGAPFSFRLWSPGFLCANVLFVEPASVLVLTAAWLCVLLNAYGTAAWVAGAGLLWRVAYDLKWEFAGMAWPLRWRALALKISWVLATGMWLASLAYAALALLIIIAMALSAASQTRGRRTRIF